MGKACLCHHFAGPKSILYLLNFHVNSSVREEVMQNFSSGQALPLCAWFDTGCQIVECPKKMLGAELPSATMNFS